MSWPTDKLTVIVDALALTGNNAAVVADDGSEEWEKGSVSYEAALPYAIEGKDWKFGTLVVPLISTGVPPGDPLFDTAYAKPPDLLHLVWLRLNNIPVEYQILNNQIVLNNSGNQTVTIKYVRAPTPDQATPSFMMGLRCFVMSGIYRGLNEDIAAAKDMWGQGEAILLRAATRSDQEQPKRAMFNSRMAASRLIRRPWRRTPSGWGGGIPH